VWTLCGLCIPYGFNYAGQFDDFDVVWTIGPIVAPANDDVTTVKGMAVVAEIAALKFKFDGDALPAAGSDQAHGFAIGEARLYVFDQVAELFRQHTKQEDDTLFVDGFVWQPGESSGIAVGWAALTMGIPLFAGWCGE
jgi:hypothetical protein